MTRLLALAAFAGTLLSSPASTAEPLRNDAVVRIQAGSIEGGWHRGRLHLDDQKCWMVKLDQPTRDQYTMLALIVVDRIELAADANWTALELQPVLAAQPKVCREYAND